MAKKDKDLKKDDDILAGASLSEEEGKKKKKKKDKENSVDNGKQTITLKVKKPNIAKKTKNIIIRVVAVVVVVALLVTYVCTGTVRKGFIHSTLQWTANLTAITITTDDGEKYKIPVSTYNYYFAMLYNNYYSTQETYEEYGIDLESVGLDVDFDEKLSSQTTTNDDGEVVTWAEYMKEEVLESIKSTYLYYIEAVEANGGEEPEITEDQQEELDETLEELEETANGYGYTLSGYLVQALGVGVTESVYRREATRSYIAENYTDELSEEFENYEYSDDELSEYKEEYYEDLEAVSVRIFECDSEDEAEAFADELESDGSNFSDLVLEYQTNDEEFYELYYAEDGATTLLYATRSDLENAGYAIATAEDSDDEDSDDEDTEESYPGLDWLFSEDREAGDTYQYSTTVVYVLDPVSVPDEGTVNVRHILITPEDTDEDDDIVDEDADTWEEALETAEEILAEFEDGDQTAESFAELAETYTEDSNGDDGGLYEDIYPGEMVTTFNSWCFESHESGDTAIIISEYGYHIMYFESENDQSIWEYTTSQSLASDDASEYSEELDEAYTAKFNWFGQFYLEKDVDIDS